MDVRRIHDRTEIERFLRRDPELHIYCLGDLDDFFWPRTTWYGCQESGELQEVVLMYAGKALPTVVGISEEPPRMTEMLREMAALLPERFHAHLSPGVEKAFEGSHKLSPHGPHYRMALRDVARVRAVECSEVIRLSENDLDDVLSFYTESYPGNWFDATMLQTGQYFGARVGSKLVSAAGVHVYSPSYRVAALGNITTHLAHRKRRHGKRVTARLCQSLLADVDHIGLNVKTDNEAAVTCYRKLGFETVALYEELNVERIR
jgi:ribosomal protein S18 acetylase RimI-like enzyme